MTTPVASTSALASLLLQPTSSAPPSYLTGSKDLISLFSLNPLYNTYVLPYLTPSVLASIPGGGAGVGGTPSKSNEKGKGKEAGSRDPSLPPSLVISSSHGAVSSEMAVGGSLDGSMGAGAVRKIGFSMGGIKLGGDTGAAEAVGGKGAKKKKLKFEKTYESLVSDVAGRNTIKKDSHLLYLVMNPDFPPVHITPFDEETLRDGFMLRAGGIPGFDPSIFLESKSESQSSPKKKKKKRGHDSSQNPGNKSSIVPGGSGTSDEHRGKKARI